MSWLSQWVRAETVNQLWFTNAIKLIKSNMSTSLWPCVTQREKKVCFVHWIMQLTFHNTFYHFSNTSSPKVLCGCFLTHLFQLDPNEEAVTGWFTLLYFPNHPETVQWGWRWGWRWEAIIRHHSHSAESCSVDSTERVTSWVSGK